MTEDKRLFARVSIMFCTFKYWVRKEWNLNKSQHSGFRYQIMSGCVTGLAIGMPATTSRFWHIPEIMVSVVPLDIEEQTATYSCIGTISSI